MIQFLFLIQYISMSYQTLKVQELQNGTIVRVTISRTKAMNAMSLTFFKQIGQVFKSINSLQNARVAILQADGKIFSAGLDLKEASEYLRTDNQKDASRNAINIYKNLREMQATFGEVYKCRVPVIVGIHSLCIGGGVDLVSACDIRYSTKDAKFTIKEIDIGMAADLGTLQLFPRLTGNQSTFKELAYTGRYMDSEQAVKIGFVTKIFQDKLKLQAGLLETAKIIASKSPVGIYTIKQALLKAQSKEYEEGLQYMGRTNSVMLQTKDMSEAITAFLMKQKPVFSKL